MISGGTSHYSLDNFIIVISQRILESHSNIESPQKFLISTSGMRSRTILPHHIHNPSGFRHSQMLNVTINIPVSIVHLADNGYNVSRCEIGNGNVAVF